MKLVGERRALAAVIFALYALLYFVLGFSKVQPEMTRALYGLAGVYGLAFFSLVAGYFWARWYAVGVGLYGVFVSALGIWQIGPEPLMLFIGITHLAAALMLWGNSMSASYDGQTKWRERYHMDDNAVHRLGRSVIRAGVSLPIVLIYALMPRAATSASLALAVPALLLTVVGIRGLVRMRTWGLFALGGAAGLLLAAAATAHVTAAFVPTLAGALLASATLPFATPIARFIRG